MSKKKNESEEIDEGLEDAAGEEVEPDAPDGPDEADLGDEDLDEAFGDDGELLGISIADDDDDDDEEESTPTARKVDDDDDDDEDLEPEDVEADLEAILKARMAATDDDDDDQPAKKPSGAEVASKQKNEFVCEICYLVVNRAQLDVPCPMGDGVEPHKPVKGT